MSSSRKTPVQDITNKKNQDPKEGQRQRDRERYANNRDEICKCQRQLRELNKQSTAAVNDETQAIGQSGVTQIQYRATEEGMPLDVQHYATVNHILQKCMEASLQQNQEDLDLFLLHILIL